MDKKYLDYALEQLRKIIEIPSPSGFTFGVSRYVFDELTSMGYKPVKTLKGGIIADISMRNDRDKDSSGLGGVYEENGLVLCSHMDTLGAMVMEVKENGRLKLSPVGGLSANNTEAENVRVHTRGGKVYTGTFQLINPSVHVNKDYNEKQRSFDTMELVLDERVSKKDEVALLGIKTGDYVSFESRFTITDSGFIKSRFLDDKLSCGILLALAKQVKEEKVELNRRLYLYFTVYEEVGHGAGGTLPSGVSEMIAVDMGCVGEGLNCDESMVSICAQNSRGPSTYELVDALINTAEKNQLNYCVDLYPFYGSDADLAVRAGHEIRHCTMGAGVSASHGYERTHIDGLCNTYKLLFEYIRGGSITII